MRSLYSTMQLQVDSEGFVTMTIGLTRHWWRQGGIEGPSFLPMHGADFPVTLFPP
jgi:hypothetical protein